MRKLGLLRYDGRSDRQNEVWAGQPINMAAKLASLSPGNELWVSHRFFEKLHLQDLNSVLQWETKDISSDERFSFDTAYILRSNWPGLYGEYYCKELLKIDKQIDNQRKIERILQPVYSLMNLWKRSIK